MHTFLPSANALARNYVLGVSGRGGRGFLSGLLSLNPGRGLLVLRRLSFPLCPASAPSQRCLKRLSAATSPRSRRPVGPSIGDFVSARLAADTAAKGRREGTGLEGGEGDMIMPSESKVSGVCCAFLVVAFSCSLASASPDGEERIAVTAI